MILLVTYDVRRPGGIERLSLQVFEQLQQLGLQPRLLATRHLGPGVLGRWLGRFWFLLQLLWWLPQAKSVFCMHVLLLKPLKLRALFPALAARPLYCWLHGIEVWGQALAAARRDLRACTALAASSTFTAQQVRDGLPACPPITVVHPCSDLKFPDQIQPPGLPLRLLTVARLDAGERYKGHDQILDALHLLKQQGVLDPEFRWIVVGDGNDRTRLQEKALRLGVAVQIDWRGRLSDQQLIEEFGRCSVFVMPSGFSIDAAGQATGEGFGIAYLEAAMAGRASIGALLGGQQDLIIDGETGWLVSSSAHALADLLVPLSAQRSLVAERGEAAYLRAQTGFTRGQQAAQLAVLLAEQ
ncbi:glycosyltransferase family 4 protein [Synechococcus sp. A10-1-5-1]|uniref:glycosyltransferase family 4 protein n=1 Tax=Synechococcus sp. A10-1-5-1 TaxID=2936507 RepID=UPI0020005EDF|nr:glycosyltransferase family 4 protein [Synechococcus sp. A10-1-5-1]UPM49232.1 glycosyltransferase family 4 protein [Synechococcus sp. A10-1-5-1]